MAERRPGHRPRDRPGAGRGGPVTGEELRHLSPTQLQLALDAPEILFARVAAELAVILAIVYTPAGNWLFGTAPLDAWGWLAAAGFALVMLALEEGRKVWVRQTSHDRS